MITTLFSFVVQVRHLAESLTSKIGVSVPGAPEPSEPPEESAHA